MVKIKKKQGIDDSPLKNIKRTIMPNTISIPSKKHRIPHIRFKVIDGNISVDKNMATEMVNSYISNLQRSASVEINSENADGEWSPLDFLFRTIRPCLDLKSISPETMDIITALMGAGVDSDRRVNVLKSLLKRLNEKALARVNVANLKDFNILIFMRSVFEDDFSVILATKGSALNER